MDRGAPTGLPAAVISVVLNGDAREVPNGTTVADLVDLVYATRAIAIARNGEIVPRSTWAAIELQSADRLEVLSAAPGG